MAQAVFMLLTARQKIPNRNTQMGADKRKLPSSITVRGRNSLTGLTLLEVLIAAVIFTIGVTAIIWALNSGIYAAGGIENVDLALNIAQAKMEEIKNTAFGNLTDSGPAADANFPRFSTTVNVAEGQNPMQADVTVAWPVKGGSTSVTLTTLVANY